MNPADVVEKLRAAKTLLLRDGWRQGSYGPTNPDARGVARCITGALAAVAGCEYHDTADARHALKETLPSRPISVGHWNDADGRTVDDVIDLIDKTIDRLEAKDDPQR